MLGVSRALIILLPVALCAPVVASAQIPGLEEWSEAIAQGIGGRRWEGPRVELPAPDERPDVPVATRSLLAPLAVHAGRDVSEADVAAALSALEAAWLSLREAGWGEPLPDGGRGGTAGFDLYLERGAELGASAGADPQVYWSYHDGVSSFARVDPDVADVDACVADAYAQALLLALDPAEAREWRRATSAWLAFGLTGRWGCEEHVITQQREPWRSWIAGAAGEGSGGALFLAMLSAQHDRGTGAFIRDLWQLARQRTWEGYGLRASPDLWEALEVSIEVAGDDLYESIEDFASARWFGGDARRERAAPIPIVRALPGEASVPFHDTIEWRELPEHTPEADPPLEPFGSGYVRVSTRDAPDGTVLRVWLRGEYGVRWSLVAVRLDANGRELARLSAPPRREPRSYLVLELMDDTDEVILVVTNLSSRLPDADEPDENIRSFKLIASETPGTAN